jgi:deoxyribodipyrimidine photolyase-related protein
VRGVYWLKMPGYGDENALGARRALPAFFWDGETPMNCLASSIGETWDNAYAHHIQRLMVIGNFCLLAGLDPKAVQEWYLIVYHDAYEWVEMPNVVGMILFADGGFLASKPYAASGAYIDRMSDYCASCAYDVKKRTGPGACPFNYLYWDFLARHRRRLETNHRMRMILRNLDRMDDAHRRAIADSAAAFLDGLG